MRTHATGFGITMQPHAVAHHRHDVSVNSQGTKHVLWANVAALMRHRYGHENLTRLATDCKIGPGTASRIKAQETSVGIDVLEKIGDFFGLDPWQLLVPGLDPATPPALRPVGAAERELYERLMSAAAALAPSLTVKN